MGGEQSDPLSFEVMYREEWAEIRTRRNTIQDNAARIWGLGEDQKVPTPIPDSDPSAPPPNLVGLAFSGGGIRSATICLGVLQKLNDLKLLPIFDYLSTVSGGGFVGGWWSAWLSRENQHNSNQHGLFPPPEQIEPQRSHQYVESRGDNKLKEGSINAGIDPIHHLRLYANYLTPRKGLLSGDTWLAVAVVSRNLVLTWLILLPVIFAAVMVGRLFFVMGPGTVRLDEPGYRSFPYTAAFWTAKEDAHDTGEAERPVSRAGTEMPGTYWRQAGDRLPFAAAIPLAALVLLAYLTFRWLQTVQVDDRKAAHTLIWIPLLLLLFGVLAYVVWVFRRQPSFSQSGGFIWTLSLFLAATIGGLICLLFHFDKKFNRLKEEGKLDPEPRDNIHFRRNIIIREHVHLLQSLVLISAILALAGFGHLLIEYVFRTGGAWLRAGGWATLATAIGGWIFTAIRAAPAGGADERSRPSLPSQIVFAATPVLVLVLLALTAAWLGNLLLEGLAPTHSGSALAFVAINSICFGVLCAFSRKEKENLGRRARAAVHIGMGLALALLATSFLLQFTHLPNYEICRRLWLAFLVFQIVMISVGWVIILGWTTDPNWLSLHGFYKVRLIRAYLGASNSHRGAARQDITESASHDDIPLHHMLNCQRGGPYHLINTTLNLVGGHDLTTAQRHAAYFTFSKLYCGSVRTRYRPSVAYMNGNMSLGTAVAISGAAASPNMGAKTPSAALAMLMTLNNVRLGYWAPTPHRDQWPSPQARLWPYYTLREFLSQTNDLGDYCYLTDGGHFENSALYSLIERGCKYIVLMDCGADPRPPCFADMGDALRRCRMDFGTQIDLKIDALGSKDKEAAQHLIVGTIEYSEAHLTSLGLTASDKSGIIVWIKPVITGDESADVRQYAIENKNFPQQTTADQWFDEAQFESYRKLGEHSIDAAFAKVVKELDGERQPIWGEAIRLMFERLQNIHCDVPPQPQDPQPSRKPRKSAKVAK